MRPGGSVPRGSPDRDPLCPGTGRNQRAPLTRGGSATLKKQRTDRLGRSSPAPSRGRPPPHSRFAVNEKCTHMRPRGARVATRAHIEIWNLPLAVYCAQCTKCPDARATPRPGCQGPTLQPLSFGPKARAEAKRLGRWGVIRAKYTPLGGSGHPFILHSGPHSPPHASHTPRTPAAAAQSPEGGSTGL